MRSSILVTAVASLCICLVCLPSGARGFDGERKGLVIGGGAGPGLWYDSHPEPVTKGGLVTDLKVGWGINSELLLFLTTKPFWCCGGAIVNPMAGITYYLNEHSPSFHLSGGLGVSQRINIRGTGDPYFTTVHLGAGYEASAHLSIEATVIRTEVAAGTVSGDWFFGLALNVLAY